MLDLISFLLVVAIAVTAAIGIRRRNRRLSSERQRGITGLAADHGFQLTATDDALATRWSRYPFGTGDPLTAVNVLTGRYRDRQLTVFEHKFSVYREGTYRYSVVVIRLPAALPHVAVFEAPEGLDTVAVLLRAEPVEVESERFNERFRVVADDERYGHAVIHPRMMELLLNGGDVPWRIDGADLIGWMEGPLEAGDVLPRIAALSDVADLIPPFVLADYGRDPSLG